MALFSLVRGLQADGDSRVLTRRLVNGAQKGIAGFGLANDPTLTALLYDPAQPLVRPCGLTARRATDLSRLLRDRGRLCVYDGRASF